MDVCHHCDASHAGERRGRYVLRERLAAGGLGTVWTAWDPELERRVAIKVVNTGGREVLSTQAMPRLVREAKAVARVSHPNVVAVHDVGTAMLGDGAHEVYVVLELVDGDTLTHWLAREDRSVREILAVFADIARGLAAVHRAGLVHRDVKPSNILVDREGRARVLDFGLARALGPETPTRDDATGPVALERDGYTTQDGFVVGTPGYMAPEQHCAQLVEAAADQYAFCVALFEALHGRRPFVEASSLEELYRIKRRGPLSVRTRGVTRPLDRMLRRGLQPVPRDRHRSMADLLAVLTRELGRARGSRLARAAVVALVVPGSLAVDGLRRAWLDHTQVEPATPAFAAAARLGALPRGGPSGCAPPRPEGL
jgi:serine/threonine protein kinase